MGHDTPQFIVGMRTYIPDELVSHVKANLVKSGYKNLSTFEVLYSDSRLPVIYCRQFNIAAAGLTAGKGKKGGSRSSSVERDEEEKVREIPGAKASQSAPARVADDDYEEPRPMPGSQSAPIKASAPPYQPKPVSSIDTSSSMDWYM